MSDRAVAEAEAKLLRAAIASESMWLFVGRGDAGKAEVLRILRALDAPAVTIRFLVEHDGADHLLYVAIIDKKHATLEAVDAAMEPWSSLAGPSLGKNMFVLRQSPSEAEMIVSFLQAVHYEDYTLKEAT